MKLDSFKTQLIAQSQFSFGSSFVPDMTTHFKKCQSTTNDPWSLGPPCGSLTVSPRLPAPGGALPVGGTPAPLLSSPQPGRQDSSLPPEEQILRSRIKDKANPLIRGKNNPLCR